VEGGRKIFQRGGTWPFSILSWDSRRRQNARIISGNITGGEIPKTEAIKAGVEVSFLKHSLSKRPLFYLLTKDRLSKSKISQELPQNININKQLHVI
jgi:hypothetical protein